MTVSDVIARYAQMSEDEQMQATISGDKPMCSVASRHHTDLPYIEVPLTVKYYFYGCEGSYPLTDYLYYKTGNQEQAERAAVLLAKDKTPDEHRELGLLLGYTQQEVDDWVAQV